MPGTSPSIIHSLNPAYIFLSNTFLKAASFKSLRVNSVSCHDHDRDGSWYTFVLIYIQQVLERVIYASVQFSSVTQSCLTVCDPMNRSTPGLPVHHQLLEFTQTHVHWVSDAIQPSHLLSSPSPPALNLSQHQDLFQWKGGWSIGVSASTSVLPANTQDWSPLGWTSWISLCPRDSKGSSPAPQFKSIDSLILSLLYGPTLTSVHDYWKSYSFD